LGSLIVIAAMFALLWLLLIRPQRQAAAQRERMTREVDVGDEILSSGGVYGTVRGVGDDDDELYVEIAPGVEVRMDRRAVGAVVKVDESDDADGADDAADELDEADELEDVEGEAGHAVAAEADAAARPDEPEPSAHGTIDRRHG
jgi:preprotein translocase subunit YajC